jgi:hypothetical protein
MVLSNELEPADATACAGFAPTRSDAFRQAAAAEVSEYKAGVLRAFRDESEAFLHVIRLAINEAEGLASSTPYAHLLLPVLVEEKLESMQRCENGFSLRR